MRDVTLLMLGLLALVPARAAAGERAVAGSSTYLSSGRTFSQSPYYYRYTSPYYYRGGFLSPYLHPAPRYNHPRVTPRYDPSNRYDRTGRFDTRRYDRSYLDRFDNRRFDHSYNRLDRGLVDRFHRPVPSVTPRLRVPAPGTNDRYHFRGSGSFRGGNSAGSIGRR
jgi:hypothetical protein